MQQGRDHLEIETAALPLSHCVLPSCGLTSLLETGTHPLFELGNDVAALIPWEALIEQYTECTVCKQRHALLETLPPKFCNQCGNEVHVRSEILGLTQLVSHRVRFKPGKRQDRPPAADGHEFLVIEDPRGDLYNDSSIAEQLQEHVDQIRKSLGEAGFQVVRLKGANASAAHVLEALASPALAGVYYFGHGIFPVDESQGRLLLADRAVYAQEIEAIPCAARLVFLNACEAAATGGGRKHERIPLSVGQAFCAVDLPRAAVAR